MPKPEETPAAPDAPKPPTSIAEDKARLEQIANAKRALAAEEREVAARMRARTDELRDELKGRASQIADALAFGGGLDRTAQLSGRSAMSYGGGGWAAFVLEVLVANASLPSPEPK